ncbi:MAG: hypothetical protein KAI81_05200, partial [Candidatus Marinimicrobia bacterium]|nr:hypothetical protein [Candidatus Neomarinimicrobiota bacterium]
IRRTAPDNSIIKLLNVFCLSFLGTKNNENLEKELENNYIEGMIEYYKRLENKNIFWDSIFLPYNENIVSYIDPDKLEKWTNEIELLVHVNEVKQITKKYLEQ